MSEIRAIETVYKGYRFRSRLEARWAVFFDALGIEYDYEPQGFELGEGMRYHALLGVAADALEWAEKESDGTSKAA